jgi:hypothetical protein
MDKTTADKATSAATAGLVFGAGGVGHSDDYPSEADEIVRRGSPLRLDADVAKPVNDKHTKDAHTKDAHTKDAHTKDVHTDDTKGNHPGASNTPSKHSGR